MKTRPFFAGKILAIDIEAHDVAVFCACCDRLGRARLEAAAQVKMMRVVAPDRSGDNPKIGLGEKGSECPKIIDDRRSRKSHRRQRQSCFTKLVPRPRS